MFENNLLVLSIFSMLFAQFLKIPIGYIIDRKINFKRIFETGGMPSSHSAFIVSLTVGIARKNGIHSSIFALSLVMAFIVMYDAMGIRRAAGQHAKLLNIIVENEEADKKLGLPQIKLKELLGHTPFEVLGGAILGIIIGLIFPL
ncbi:MAG: divergent PAP2 family protein [Clostridium sp.]|uniref:divergent PAP2 family protein n=1 Tax=Clostridium sp. TaxID=1506 RepID=UPI003EE46FC8